MNTARVEKAEVSFPSDAEVRVIRDFKAPRALVWQAHTDPALVRRWMLGPPGWSMPVCEMDVRPGGKYRWRWRSDEDGKEFGFFGEFLDVEAPARLAHSETYDPGDIGGAMDADNPAVIRATFTERNGVTRLESVMAFASKEIRDAALSTGMTDGMELSYQNLDKLVSETREG